MYPVYLITCLLTLMQYVGCCPSGKSIEERFEEHCKPSSTCRYLRHAIAKHGRAQFTVQQIDAGSSPEQALELEQFWIAALSTKAPNGYNLTDGGEGVLGHKHSVETKLRIGATNIGRKPALGKHWKLSEETIAKQNAAKRGSKSLARSEAQRGNTHGRGISHPELKVFNQLATTRLLRSNTMRAVWARRKEQVAVA
jgi:group I intron endonuclease